MNNYDLKYTEDGSVDLVWFNSLSKDDQIMFCGFWTEEQWLKYKTKKAQLSQEEILDCDIETDIENCIKTDKIEKKKFNDKDYYLGRKRTGDFILVSPYFDNFYKKIRHLYLEINGFDVCENFSYENWYNEYEYKKISEAEYSKLYGIFSDFLLKFSELLKNSSHSLNRKLKEGDYVHLKYGDLIQINEIFPERNEFSYNGYLVDGMGFYIGESHDKVINIVISDSLNRIKEESDSLITEKAFLKGFKLASQVLFELKKYLKELFRD